MTQESRRKSFLVFLATQKVSFIELGDSNALFLESLMCIFLKLYNNRT